MGDFGDDEWTRMLCVETANVKADAVTLEPGATHTMSAHISVRSAPVELNGGVASNRGRRCRVLFVVVVQPFRGDPGVRGESCGR